MACYTPMRAWYSKEVNESGKRSLVFDDKNAEEKDMPIKIACGQCIGCRLKKSGEWANRMMDEASLYENNCFLTLTFDDASMYERKEPWNLDKTESQKFIKRLRKSIESENPYKKEENQKLYRKWQKEHKIKYYICGEYGDENNRPHYHAIIFNYDFDDKEIATRNDRGDKVYTSKKLEKLWTFGMCRVGEVTLESTGYTARYSMKKINGEMKEEHYQRIDSETGEIFKVIQEYATMSTRPAIGKEFYEKYKDDMYPKDFLMRNGKKTNIPKYYDKLEEKYDGIKMDDIKEIREEKGLKHQKDQTDERLKVREKCQQLKADTLKRRI